MRYTIQPGVGVGAIRFGLTIEEMRLRLGPPDEEGLWETTGERQDWWEGDGLSVLYDASGVCVEIALVPPATARLDGHKLLGVPDEEALAALRELDADAEEEDGILVSSRLGIALTRNDDDQLELLMLAPDRMEDRPDEADAAENDAGENDDTGEEVTSE
jgi:hypothetical protein